MTAQSFFDESHRGTFLHVGHTVLRNRLRKPKNAKEEVDSTRLPRNDQEILRFRHGNADHMFLVLVTFSDQYPHAASNNAAIARRRDRRSAAVVLDKNQLGTPLSKAELHGLPNLLIIWIIWSQVKLVYDKKQFTGKRPSCRRSRSFFTLVMP